MSDATGSPDPADGPGSDVRGHPHEDGADVRRPPHDEHPLQPTDPYEGLDPDVVAFLEAGPGTATGPRTASVPGGALPGGPVPGGPIPGRPGSAHPSAGPSPAQDRSSRRHDRASWGAGAAMLAVVVAAGALDPSGLAAPVAWSGARLARQPWTWLQYAVLAPLIVALVWLWTRRLLAAATPAAPRRWVFGRVWLLVVLAMMVAKLGYSVVLMAPALLGGHDDGLPAGSSAVYLVWATGFTGIKAGFYGWVPALVAAVLWSPGRARRAGVPARVDAPSRALIPAALIAVGLAALGGWLSRSWWTGSPVGYAHPSGWRLLAPTAASGRAGEIAAILLVATFLAMSIRHTLCRIDVPRPSSARLLAGALGALMAGLLLALVESLVHLAFGTDVPGADDLWILPATYLRLAEGMSFGLLVAPLAALGLWFVARAPRQHWSLVAGAAACGLVVGAAVLVARQTQAYEGLPPLAGADPAPVALPAQVVIGPGQAASPGPITVRRDADGSAVLSDQRGAQVILRGMNVNQLGDYYAADPDVPTIEPLTEQDFVDIAAMGFNSVRLVLSWSQLEPSAGEIDPAAIQRAKQAVAWAAKHGIHVVLDLHQDAWGKGVVAAEGVECRRGTEPLTGWDGAPDWASFYDGAPPCQFSGRDLAPNVLRAFTSFYTDREAIQNGLVAVWGRLASEFGAEPAVVGYDLLNEPAFGEQAPLTSGMLLGRYHARVIEAIRRGEARAPGGYTHPVFLEPSIWWSGLGVDPLPPHGFTTDSQVVFSPHLYNTVDQSLGLTTVGIERGYALAARAAAAWGAPLWVGEWATFGDPTDNLARNLRFGAVEDSLRVGSAVWVWKQACGDPHVYPGTVAGNIRRVACPQGTALSTDSAEIEPLKRPYPRAAPGRILAIRSEGRHLQVDGDTAGAGPVDGTPDTCALDVWVPGAQQPAVVDSFGVTDVRAVEVPAGSAAQDPSGGWRVLGCATGAYRLTLS